MAKKAEQPTVLVIQLASVIAHLLEYIDTQHSLDYDAALGVLKMDTVREPLNALRDASLAPLRRDGADPFYAFELTGHSDA